MKKVILILFFFIPHEQALSFAADLFIEAGSLMLSSKARSLAEPMVTKLTDIADIISRAPKPTPRSIYDHGFLLYYVSDRTYRLHRENIRQAKDSADLLRRDGDLCTKLSCAIADFNKLPSHPLPTTVDIYWSFLKYLGKTNIEEFM